MKNNKPIRYTTMQVYDSYNYSDIPIYIVTKCFLDEEVTKYLMNGKTRKEYKVTFPYSLNNRTCEYDMQYNWQDYNRKIVNKVFDNYEDAKRYTDELNKKMLSENRRISTRNMIYFGDGLTDIPSMRMIRESNGYAIAVYQNDDKKVVSNLIKDNRIDFYAKANYEENSDMDKLIKDVLNEIAIKNKLNNLHKSQIKEVE